MREKVRVRGERRERRERGVKAGGGNVAPLCLMLPDPLDFYLFRKKVIGVQSRGDESNEGSAPRTGPVHTVREALERKY